MGDRTVTVGLGLHHAAPLLTVGVSIVFPLPEPDLQAIRRQVRPLSVFAAEGGVRLGPVSPGYFETPAVTEYWWADLTGREREVGWEMVAYLEEKALPWVEAMTSLDDVVAWRQSIDVSYDRVLRRRV